MTNRTAMGIVLLVLAQGLAGCGGSGSSPSAPSAVPPPAAQPAPPPTSINGLMRFTEQASGFSTSDVRDAQEQIVQFSTSGELIWTADGTRFPGFGFGFPWFPNNYISNLTSCQCEFVVHFGTKDGERRAYLTADYGHDNPDTVLDLEIAGGVLTVGRTDVFPPGTYTLSGVITEVTATGQAPLEGAGVWRLNQDETGWREGTTDRNGFYEIRGLANGGRNLVVSKEGYARVETVSSIDGDTRFDVQLVRR